jgi:hypothetical protein
MTRPENQDRVGPWESADYNRFAELCSYEYDLLDDELLRNPVYLWLKTHAPRVKEDGDGPQLPYKRMLIVAQYVTLAMRPDARRGAGVFPADEMARARKWHKKVQGQIRRLQKTLGQYPQILLPRLDEALAWALPLLDVRATKAAQPWLLRLARELHRETGSADAQLLLEVADALKLELDERTAQRYVKEAREAVTDR